MKLKVLCGGSYKYTSEHREANVCAHLEYEIWVVGV